MNNRGKALPAPKLRFPEFRGARGWTASQLIDLTDVGLSNGVFNDPKKVGTGYKLINVGDMYIDTTIVEERLSLLTLSISDFEANQVKHGDIFFTRSSLVKSGIAVSNIYLGNSSDVTFDGHLIRFRANSRKVTPLFAHYLFKTTSVREQLVARGKSGTMTTIGQSDVGGVMLSYPEMNEQRRVADCLSALDELIAAQARKVDALKTHKKGLMQQLLPREGEIQPRLRFPEFNNAGEWTPKTIGQLGEVVTGSTPSTAKPEYYGGDRHFISPADISDSRFIDKTKTTLTELGFLETRPLKTNSILFVCIGSTIGKIAQNRQECATNQQINAVMPNSENFEGFVYYALNGIADKIANIAGRQAVPIVNKSLFSSVQLMVPKLPEQKYIANFLSSLDETILAEGQQFETLKIHKKSLMQQLFPSMEEAV